jgi:hypothetical protein
MDTSDAATTEAGQSAPRIRADGTSHPLPQRLFFRWGKPDLDKSLLKAGGFQPGVDGSVAKLNAAVVQKAFDLYRAAGKTDQAGPGLYVSADPVNSSNFGTNLLVVTVASTTGEPVVAASSQLRLLPEQKAKAEAAHKKPDLGTLPLALLMNDESWWYVLYRGPVAADHATVSFRPPTAADVDPAWEDAKVRPGIFDDPGKDLFEFAKSLAQTLNGVSPVVGTLPPREPSAQTFVKALFLDKAVPFLEDLFHSPDRDRVAPHGSKAILKAMEALIPNDPRTQTMRDWVALP